MCWIQLRVQWNKRVLSYKSIPFSGFYFSLIEVRIKLCEWTWIQFLLHWVIFHWYEIYNSLWHSRQFENMFMTLLPSQMLLTVQWVFWTLVQVGILVLQILLVRGGNEILIWSNSDLVTTSSSNSNNPTNAKQTDLSKSIMSLRRLYLCFSDLIDLLESCAEALDDGKRKSLYSQIEPSVGLVRVAFCWFLLSCRIHWMRFETVITVR